MIRDLQSTFIPSVANPSGDPNLLASNIIPSATIGGIKGTYSNVKSIQRGSIAITSTSQNIVISAVTTANSIVRIYNQASTSSSTGDFSGTLTSSTNLNITNSMWTVSQTIYWEVIEFNNVKSLQTGTYSLSVTSTTGVMQTVTISSINSVKALLFSNETSSSSTADGQSIGVILNSTTLGFNTVYATKTIKWQVIEFN
jgi:hypothetical protein